MLAKLAPGVMDLLSAIPEEPSAPKANPRIFPVVGLGGIPEASKAQGISKLRRQSRPGISLGFNSDTIQQTFAFG